MQTLGNHEFDKGPEAVKSYVKQLTVPVTTCNVVPRSTSPLYGVVVPGPLTILLKLEEGQYVRVGIVGWTTADTPNISSPGPDVDFLDIVTATSACVGQLVTAGVKHIIGLGHAGIYGSNSADVLVARSVPGQG